MVNRSEIIEIIIIITIIIIVEETVRESHISKSEDERSRIDLQGH